MKNENLLKESLKVAFTKQSLLFVLICSGVALISSVIPVVGGIIGLVFSILFGAYCYNIALQFALKKHFPKLGNPKIITKNPLFGKNPPVMFVWSLLYSLGLCGVIILFSFLVGAIYSATNNPIVAIVLCFLAIVASVIYMWLIFYPQVLGKVLGDDKDFKKDFISNYNKKYFLIIMVGGIINLLICSLIGFCLFGGTIASLLPAIASNSSDMSILMQYASSLTISAGVVVTISSFVGGVINIVAYYYAYASWLDKTDLKQVASNFGLSVKEKECEFKNTSSTPETNNTTTVKDLNKLETSELDAQQTNKQEITPSLDAMINDSEEETIQPSVEVIKEETPASINGETKTIKININRNQIKSPNQTLGE